MPFRDGGTRLPLSRFPGCTAELPAPLIGGPGRVHSIFLSLGQKGTRPGGRNPAVQQRQHVTSSDQPVEHRPDAIPSQLSPPKRARVVEALSERHHDRRCPCRPCAPTPPAARDRLHQVARHSRAIADPWPPDGSGSGAVMPGSRNWPLALAPAPRCHRQSPARPTAECRYRLRVRAGRPARLPSPGTPGSRHRVVPCRCAGKG